jgi:hypothetical protein
VIKDWLRNISSTERYWRLIQVIGPQQEKDDIANSGVYVANMICLWRLGVMEIPSDMDVMATRRRLLEVLSMAADSQRPLDNDAPLLTSIGARPISRVFEV